MSPSLERHVVTAVLVAHDGARWLPETLKALLTQTRPVQRLVAVDSGSHDRGPAVLSEVVGAGNLLRLPRTTGYGEAIAEALRHPAAAIPVPPGESNEPQVEWVWLVHDDCAPAHDALDRLLTTAESDPNATILGPKLRDWRDRRMLLEIGVSIDGAGRRWTGIDRGEFDQGQHDGVHDVLAVSTAGMLIRRDVWEDLGGFDLEFGLFREDVDLGWRAHASGHRVVVVTDAVAYHAEASARGLRETGMTAEHGRRRDRRNALYVLLANLPLPAMLAALVRNTVGSLLRALFLLLAKQPVAARDELGALGDVLSAPGRLRRARSRRAHNRKRVYRSIKRFQPRRVALRRLAEQVAALAAPDSHGRHGADEEAEPLTDTPGLVRRFLGHPGVLLVLALAALAVAAERSLLTTAGQLGGGALVPAWGGASDLWAQYLAGWHPVGLGSDTGSPPYIGVLALLSTLLFGKPWVAVMVLLLGCVPLAGLTAYVAARSVVLDPPPSGRRALAARRRIPVTAVRLWIAVTYALLPAVTGAVSAGRLGTAVVIVLLPLIGLFSARLFGLPHRTKAAATGGAGVSRAGRAASGARPVSPAAQARRAAWAVALLLAVAMGFVPLIWLLAVIVGVLAWVAFGSAGPGTNRNLLIALGVPPLLVLPWTIGLILHPSRFLLEAGLHRPELVETPLPAGSMLALDPGGPGTPTMWVTLGLLVVAVLGLRLRSRRTAVLAGWMLALFGLLAAILMSALMVTKGADRAPAWPGTALTFAAAGVMVAATAVLLRAIEILAGRHLLYRAGAALVVLVALTAPVLAAASWVVTGAAGPLSEVSTEAVPGLSSSATRPRTLVLSRDAHGRVSYTVVRGTEPRLGEPELPTADAARRRMDGLVAGLASGRGAGDGQALTRMGIAYVLVPDPAGDPVTKVLDAAPELTRLGRTTGFAIWRLLTPGGRLMLVDGPVITVLPARDTTALVRIPPGSATRTLLLAEPADGGWHARIGGSEAKGRVVDGWAQGYRVPASGGEFTLSRGTVSRQGWIWLQAAGVLLVLVLALPGGQMEESVAAARERHRSRGRRVRTAESTAESGTESTVESVGESTGENPAESPGGSPAGGTVERVVVRSRRRAGTRRASGRFAGRAKAGDGDASAGAAEADDRTDGAESVQSAEGADVDGVGVQERTATGKRAEPAGEARP
ncbi:glycosyltransferase family 2 protein [Actinomadura sp. HBU206391]|uniref:glycosyltransferase family 2 protein n=1 Tax=Actinomadura sp. HBU206391 TaxID=2731692 RepID=UPI00164F9A41|nr:glycosyltransferase family 2 protein [Actinomadura sp. HBU206391]